MKMMKKRVNQVKRRLEVMIGLGMLTNEINEAEEMKSQSHIHIRLS